MEVIEFSAEYPPTKGLYIYYTKHGSIPSIARWDEVRFCSHPDDHHLQDPIYWCEIPRPPSMKLKALSCGIGLSDRYVVVDASCKDVSHALHALSAGDTATIGEVEVVVNYIKESNYRATIYLSSETSSDDFFRIFSDVNQSYVDLFNDIKTALHKPAIELDGYHTNSTREDKLELRLEEISDAMTKFDPYL